MSNGRYYVLVPAVSSDYEVCKKELKAEMSKESFENLFAKAEELISRLQDKNSRNVHPQVISFASTDILKNITKHDILYIAGHANFYHVGNNSSGISLTPAELASSLFQAGLNPAIKTIKLHMCDSGIHAKNILSSYHSSSPEYPVSPNMPVPEQSFAERFSAAMHQLNYEVDVAGYLGLVLEGTGSKDGISKYASICFTYADNGKERISRASSQRVWILTEDVTKNKKKMAQDTKKPKFS